jgi:hypothetical protein
VASTSTATLYTTNTTLTAPAVVGTSAQDRPKFSLRTLAPLTDPDGNVGPLTYSFEVSPNEVNVQRLGLSYAELERPGRKPLLVAKSSQLQQVSVTVLVTAVGDEKFFVPCQPRLDALAILAELDVDLIVAYPGVPSTMTWRITDLSVRTVRRNEMNEVTIAEAELTLTESIVPQAVVPGMSVIKDIPAPRTTTSKGGSSGGTTDCQKYAGDDQAIRDADDKCRLAVINGDAPVVPAYYFLGSSYPQ